MRVTGSLAAAVAAAVVAAALAATAQAQTKVAVGKYTGGSGLHIPSYIAMDKGFFKDEGLDARFVSLNGKALVTAGLSGNLDFVPIPSGGAQAALSGAEIRYVVGQSLGSQWTIVAQKSIAKVEDLKGKVLAYGRAGSADYDEGATVLARFFSLQPGKDYKVISFAGEPERIAALLNNDVQGALVTVPNAAKAQIAGMKVLLTTSDYLPRVGGSIWSPKAFVDKNPEAVKKFVKAIARGVMYFRDNKDGSIATLKEHLGVDDPKEAEFLWTELRNTFGAELPPDLFREIFEGRRIDMIAEGQWPKDKPLPDTETFVARSLLDAGLREAGYKPVTPKKVN